MVSTENRALRQKFAATSRGAPPVRFREESMRLFAVLSAAVVGGSLLVGAASAQEERTIRWGHLNNTDHPVSFGVQKFAEILLAKSGGKLKIREFASSQLGNELQQQSALRGGTQEMFSASTTSLATVVPEFGLLDFPFIVSTTDQADALVGGAYGKAMMGAGLNLPSSGKAFLSVSDADKGAAVLIARKLARLGFEIVATLGTASRLREVGLTIENVFKVNEGRPNIVDHIKSGEIALVINTPLGRVSHFDEQAIRRAALQYNVPCVTTMTGAHAIVEAIAASALNKTPTVRSLQELHAMSSSMDAMSTL